MTTPTGGMAAGDADVEPPPPPAGARTAVTLGEGWSEQEDEELVDGLEARGWTVLSNRRGRLGDVELAGMDDPHIRRDDLDVAVPPNGRPPRLRLGVVHSPYRRALDAFERNGYELLLADRFGMVARATGGIAEALAAMGEDEPPDVILADYDLDRGDTGLDAIAALRAAAGKSVAAIMVTAQRDPAIARNCAAAGVPLMEKPVRPDDLRAMLLQVMD